jgi:DNA repair protein RadC
MKKQIPVIVSNSVKSYKVEGSIREASRVAEVVRAFIGDDQREWFLAFHLNTKHYVNSIHVISIGTLNTSLVHPREVFRSAIQDSASSIIVAHNHPNGDSTPSNNDDLVTRSLVQSGNILGIQVLDHVVVGTDYYSYLDSGRLGTMF